MAQTSPTAGAATATDPIAGSAVYPLGSRVNAAGHLEVGGCDIVEVAREFGTPAYVYSPDDIRARARSYTDALRARGIDFEVLYASKAAPITAVYRICREEGLSVDVASGGELHTALAAGFEPDRIYMHGNNKSADELRMAFDRGVGCIVLDSLDEIARADALLDRDQDVLIRLTPGVEPSTHSSIRTGQLDSKFGFGIEGGAAEQSGRGGRRLPASATWPASTPISARRSSSSSRTSARSRSWPSFCRQYEPRVMNVGGGLGIAYSGGDEPPSDRGIRRSQRRRRGEAASTRCRRSSSSPGGRSSATRGSPIYSVGTVKEIPGFGPTSRSTAGCRTTCGRCSTAPSTRR